MKLSLTKSNGHLIPTQDHDKQSLSKLSDGDYLVNIKLIRDPRRHREFFGILNLVFENLPEGSDCPTSSELLYHIKERITRAYWEAGFSECVAGRINDKGKYIPCSVAFENMSEDDFDEFSKVAYRFLAMWMGMDVLDLMEWYRNQ